LDEIIVTTEFREANVQDTPIAITAVNAAMLEARSQTNLAQITAQAPNVSLRPAGSSFGNALVAYIRGIGQTDFNPSVEPGVGIYVDDVYYSTITGNVLDLLDLDRVEVLRGPQGTLAGRNAIGGAIKLFTRKADGVDDADIGLTVGDFDRTEVRGAGGLTLIPDKLFARVAGVARTSDGYVTRLDYACANNLPPPGQPGGLPTYAPSFGCELGKEGGQSYAAGRMNLRWVAGEDGNFEMNLAASFVNDDSQSQPGVLVAAKDHSGSNFPWLSPNGPVTPPFASQAVNNPTFDPNAGGTVPSYYDNNNNGTYQAGIDVPHDSRFVTGGTYTNYATYINDGNSTPSPLFQGGTPGQNMDIYKPYVVEPINHLNSSDVSLNLNWQITDNTSLLWVYAIREYENEFAEDTDGSPIAVQQLLQVMDHEQWTQELRLNTSFGDGAVDLTIGAFYLDQDTAEDARVDLPYVGFDFIHGPDLVPATNQALYAHLAFHMGERTDLSLGVRYSEDEKSYTFRRRNPDLTPVQACTTFWFWEAANPANCGVFGLDTLGVSYSSDNTDYRIALSRDIGDATMVYGQFSTGYKAGGNNARPFFPSQLNAFKPETLDSIEVGMKSTLAGNSRLNMAFFMNDYADIQLPSNVCTWALPGQTVPCASQNNVGDADVMGFEIEAEWHPGDRATIDASYSLLDFEYSRIAPNATSVTIDMVAPYTPENKFSFGAQYEFQAGRGTLTPRIDVSFQDDVFSNATNGPMNLIESYTLVNARLTWRSMNDDWRLALEATNLTDEYYYVTLFDLWGPVGYVHGQPGRPREYALSINRSF
jgi:iron complex outermembrane receptor protein